jgi:phytoene dehydrogenase-like protein
MPTSSAVRAFIASLPPNELYIDLLRDLSRTARQLAAEEPQLVGALTLIRDSFAAIANSWEGLPLSPRTSQAITPRVVAAVTKALEQPRADTFNELAKVLIWAREYPLTDGAGEEIPTN